MTNLRSLTAALCALAGIALVSGSAEGAGNMLTRATDLHLKIDGRMVFSQYEFTLETGKYYRWFFTADNTGEEDITFMAPELWKNSYIAEFKIGPHDVHTQMINDFDIDKEGEIKVFFIPIQTGVFKFWVKQWENRGLIGTVTVK